MIPLTTPRHPGGLPEPKRIHRHQGRHPVELQAEFPRAGLVGTQIPTKYVLVCAKFRLLNQKLKRIFFGTFYLIVAVFFYSFAQQYVDCIFVPTRQIYFRMSGSPRDLGRLQDTHKDSQTPKIDTQEDSKTHRRTPRHS